MDADHKRPLAAFVVVSATTALLLGQSLHFQSGDSAGNPPTASRASSETTDQSSPSGALANGQAVDGITAAPTQPAVKSIGPTPMLMARGDDDGLGIATGVVGDPDGKQASPTDGVSARDEGDSQGSGPTETPVPNPSGGPKPDPDDEDDDSQGNGGSPPQGPTDKPPRGPRNDDVIPHPHGPGAHPSGSATAPR
jgi:hypothetical protein